jgi:hypothetical protein
VAGHLGEGVAHVGVVEVRRVDIRVIEELVSTLGGGRGAGGFRDAGAGVVQGSLDDAGSTSVEALVAEAEGDEVGDGAPVGRGAVGGGRRVDAGRRAGRGGAAAPAAGAAQGGQGSQGLGHGKFSTGAQPHQDQRCGGSADGRPTGPGGVHRRVSLAREEGMPEQGRSIPCSCQRIPTVQSSDEW